MAEHVRELKSGREVDVVFECAGGNSDKGLSGHTTLHQAFRMVRPRGRVIQIAGLIGEMKMDTEVLPRRSIKRIFLEGRSNETIAVEVRWAGGSTCSLLSLKRCIVLKSCLS